MGRIPKKVKDQLLKDPRYKHCSLYGYHECGGRITFEHAIIYKGKQLQEPWSIISLCARGHEVDEYQDAGTMDKEMNVWVALNQAEDTELEVISKVIDYKKKRDYLNKIYGPYKRRFTISSSDLINY